MSAIDDLFAEIDNRCKQLDELDKRMDAVQLGNVQWDSALRALKTRVTLLEDLQALQHAEVTVPRAWIAGSSPHWKDKPDALGLWVRRDSRSHGEVVRLDHPESLHRAPQGVWYGPLPDYEG